MSLILLALSMGGITYTWAETTSSDVQAIEAAVAAFNTIKTLRQESSVNGDAIANAYTGALQTLTQEVDTSDSLKLDSEVLVAIDDIKSGHEPELAGQVIDKTLQRVFYQTIWNRITAIRDQFETASSTDLNQMLDEAVASYQAISGTVARSGEVLSADRKTIVESSNPGLDIKLNESVGRIRAALEKSNPAEDAAVIAVERYVTRISLARAYYTGILREIRGAIEHRNTDLEETRIKQKEGEIFYRIIESLVARDNPTGNALIKAQLTGDASDIVADEIVSELSKGLIGRVRGEMEGQAESIGKERIPAMAEAAGTAAYANIILPDLEVRLGTDVRNNLEAALNSLQSASNENSVSKSADARQTISTILDSYESNLNLVSYNVTSDTALVDNAVLNFLAIKDLRDQDPIDPEAIATEYSGELQQVTQFIDSSYGLTIDQDVLTAIEAIRSGNEIALASQVIDKSLQRVFVLGIYNRITLITDQFDQLSTNELALEWDRAHSAYQAIISTAAREDMVLTVDKQTLQIGSNPDLDDQITLAFVNGREALNKANADDPTNVAIARENIIIPIVRSFLIGVLREVGGIIDNRGANIEEARVEQLEADLFYRTVEVFIAQDNPLGSDRIRAQLKGDLSNVVANNIVSEINRGIIGQLNRSLTQIESTFNADKHQALIASERASLYAHIFLSDLELRLGTQQRVELQNALQDLKEASGTGDASRAIFARSIIIEIISAYQNELI